jgi:hypothetical protein
MRGGVRFTRPLGGGLATTAYVDSAVAAVASPTYTRLYNTPVASRNSSLGSTTLVSSPPAGATYVLYLDGEAVDGGTGCTGTGSVAFNLGYKSDDSNLTISMSVLGYSSSTIIGTTMALPTTAAGVASTNVFRAIPYTFTTASGTAITLSATYTAGSGCTVGENYAARPVLYRIN